MQAKKKARSEVAEAKKRKLFTPPTAFLATDDNNCIMAMPLFFTKINIGKILV